MLDPHRLDDTFPVWLPVATQVMIASRETAALMGRQYLLTLGLPALVVPDVLTLVAWRASMHALTVATVKRAMADGAVLGAAVALAQQRSLGAADRYVRDAQRDVVRKGAGELGWKWVGTPNCDYCRRKIAGGETYPDYLKFKSHDHCDCLAEPAL